MGLVLALLTLLFAMLFEAVADSLLAGVGYDCIGHFTTEVYFVRSLANLISATY